MEHNSLIRPLYALRSKGVELTIVPVGSDGVVSPEDIRHALQINTRMIALAHVSNVCGSIQPVKQLAEICRESGALFLVDAAQSAGHLALDVEELYIDLLAAPGHKGLLGPAGTGLLYIAPHVSLRSIIQGGTGGHSTAETQPLVVPDGFEAGTHNLLGIAGLKAGIDFILERGVATIHQHEQLLLKQAEQGLREIPCLKIQGSSESFKRCSALSFTAADVDASQLATELDHGFDIAVRAGLHCAPLAHQTLGTLPGGTTRLSPGWLTTSEDIAFFSAAVVQCITKIRQAA